MSALEWCWDEGTGRFTGFAGAITVGLRPDIAQPPLSPAGWWWQGTTEERGRWRKDGPYPTAEAARDAADAAFAVGAYLRGEG